ncbi:MAG: AlpA family phage regulatory protein [Robiginitomaculum sp.]|nr:AlpA family phage regulatory protein [Robiginitomaculum sp.]
MRENGKFPRRVSLTTVSMAWRWREVSERIKQR